MNTQHHQNRGFTLLELLVALMVFAVMSLMVFTGLTSVLNAYSHISEKTEQLNELQSAFSLITRDIEQAIGRPIRDSYGDPQEPMMHNGEAIGTVLEFTRTGRPNPAALPRSNLQRIAYILDDNQLMRLSWAVLDRAPDSEPLESLLLTKVKSASVRFLNKDMEWQEDWPTKTKQEIDDGVIKIPRAVELTIESEVWGEIKRLFRVPGDVK